MRGYFHWKGRRGENPEHNSGEPIQEAQRTLGRKALHKQEGPRIKLKKRMRRPFPEHETVEIQNTGWDLSRKQEESTKQRPGNSGRDADASS